MPTQPPGMTTKAEKRESEEKEKRQVAVLKRINVLSSTLDALQSSFSTKTASLNHTAYGTIRIKVMPSGL